MKNFGYLLAIFFVIALVSSCSKEDDKDLTPMGMKKSTSVVNYNPEGPDVTPVFIDGGPGGNVSCDMVSEYFDIEFCDCGEKVDVNWDEYGDVSFEGEFPEGIEITRIEEKTFDFEMTNSPGSCYKVGAVIVKGGNGAQVYFYGEEGILADNGLMAPDMKGVSNITFCMVECEIPEDLIIAVKVFYNDGVSDKFGISIGEVLFTEGWCYEWPLGVNPYPNTSPIDLNQAGQDLKIGEVTVADNIVTVKLNEGLTIDYSNLFVGTQEEFLANLGIDGCPAYWTAPWLKNDIDGNSQTFDLN